MILEMIVVNSENTEPKEKILYSEWIPMNKFVILLLVFVIAILIATAITTSILVPSTRVYMLPIYAVLVLSSVLIYINYRGMEITITNNKIKIRFGLFNKKTIAFDELVAVDVIKAKIGKYFGLGVRIAFDSSVAFITNFGDAVELKYQENKVFVFSSKSSEVICNQLKDNIKIK